MRTLRVIALSLAATIAAAPLVGCANYRPLYGSSGATEGVAVELSGITVVEQKSRAGQLVRNELMSVMRGGGSNDYVLELLPEETTKKISEPAGQKLDRYRYTLKMKYALHRSGDNTVISEGSVFSNVSYDTIEQPVSDLQAAENAKSRASKEVSADIRLRLAAYLSSH